jgi:hypothetical protein
LQSIWAEPALAADTQKKGDNIMDSTIIIRVMAGVGFAITLFYLIQRRRKKVM